MLASRGIDVLVAILALCQVTVAFYPFVPDYRCIRDPTCDPSGSLHVESVVERATTLKLKQRLPKVSISQTLTSSNANLCSSPQKRVLPKSSSFVIG